MFRDHRHRNARENWRDMSTHDSERWISTRGLVVEGDWDDSYNPICLRLETYSENQFLIKMDRIGKRLMGKCGSVIDVVGVESVDKMGRRWICVKRFALAGLDDGHGDESELFLG